MLCLQPISVKQVALVFAHDELTLDGLNKFSSCAVNKALSSFELLQKRRNSDILKPHDFPYV